MGPVIAGFNDTREGRAAATAAADEARRRGAPLLLATHEELSGTARRSPEDEERRGDLERELERLATALAGDDLEVDTEVLRTTHDAGSALAHLAEERDAQLLVIGLRRRSRVGKLLLGSNAQTALLHAPCPVLSVKPES